MVPASRIVNESSPAAKAMPVATPQDRMATLPARGSGCVERAHSYATAVGTDAGIQRGYRGTFRVSGVINSVINSVNARVELANDG